MSMSLHFVVQGKVVDSGLNMGNRNASVVVSNLGFPIDYGATPDITVSEMIRSCELYFNSNVSEIVDGGTESKQDYSGGVMLVDCGMRSGYISEKVKEILKLSLAAQLKGAEHCYFC